MILNFQKTPVDVARLDKDLKTLGLGGKYLGFTYEDDGIGQLAISFTGELTAGEQTILNDYLVSHDGTPDPQLVVRDKVLTVMREASVMIADFGSENVVLGLTSQQMGTLATNYSQVISLLMTGSGNLARATFAAIPADPANGMSQERKDAYLAKIDALLASL